MNDVTGFAATPHGRKNEEADQIINATLKALDLVGGMFELHFHGQPTVAGRAGCPARRARISCRNSPGGTKNGLCWRMPPSMTNCCLRIIAVILSPLNCERCYVQKTAASWQNYTSLTVACISSRFSCLVFSVVSQ